MRKNYSTPQTMSLEVMAHEMLCASGGPAPAPARSGSIGTMTNDTGEWD